jgi:hypothetical protein
MEITSVMLDAIFAVKGKRNPNLWDPRCARFLAKQAVIAVTPAKTKKEVALALELVEEIIN